MKKNLSFDEYVKLAILKTNKFEISEITSLDNKISLVLDRSKYESIVKLVETGETALLKNLDASDKTSGEYLYIYTFFDQNEQEYIVTIYDSNELWQDPELWDIFRI